METKDKDKRRRWIKRERPFGFMIWHTTNRYTDEETAKLKGQDVTDEMEEGYQYCIFTRMVIDS